MEPNFAFIAFLQAIEAQNLEAYWAALEDLSDCGAAGKMVAIDTLRDWEQSAEAK